MRVEQYGLGTLVGFGVFYEIEAGASVAERNARRTQIGTCTLPGCLQALRRRFITMKL